MAASTSALLPSAPVSLTPAPALSRRRAEATSPWRAAKSRGVNPPAPKWVAPAGLVVLRSPVPRNCRLAIVRAPVAAPCFSSTRTTSGSRWAAAHIRAVCPFSGSVASISAPCSISASTAAGSPVAVQRMSTVSPTASPRFASAPAASSRSTTSVLRLAHATHSGVAPSAFAASTSAPASINRFTAPGSSQRAAQCSAVAPSPCGVSTATPWSSRAPTVAQSRFFAASGSRRSVFPAAGPAANAAQSVPAAAIRTHCCLFVTSIRHDSAVRIRIQPFFDCRSTFPTCERSVQWHPVSIAESS